MEEVRVDLPAAPLLFLLECGVPPEDKTGVFAPAPFVVSSSFLRSSSTLVTAICAFVLAAEMSSVFVSSLQAAATDFFSTISSALAFFSALRSALCHGLCLGWGLVCASAHGAEARVSKRLEVNESIEVVLVAASQSCCACTSDTRRKYISGCGENGGNEEITRGGHR
jgi:hypothetical protein